MSPLRQRMDDAMVLRGFAERTREAYLLCVRSLAKYYRRRPDQLSMAELQAYLLHLIVDKKL
ncbi:phage integrase N-terminal SAM-like domain-containing protein, partial [Thauera sp. Sel9]|uniref:phage integrase N-terminal SAM-like domain-containing protein n=1 Tax=Thauera sp. Sel9 TaxID=2974299 RepID=UPI0021E16633